MADAVSLADLFRHRRVCDKDVYVVDDHHQTLAPWVMPYFTLQCIKTLLELAPYQKNGQSHD